LSLPESPCSIPLNKFLNKYIEVIVVRLKEILWIWIGSHAEYDKLL
jgi:hypothetical protein